MTHRKLQKQLYIYLIGQLFCKHLTQVTQGRICYCFEDMKMLMLTQENENYVTLIISCFKWLSTVLVPKIFVVEKKTHTQIVVRAKKKPRHLQKTVYLYITRINLTHKKKSLAIKKQYIHCSVP